MIKIWGGQAVILEVILRNVGTQLQERRKLIKGQYEDYICGLWTLSLGAFPK